MRALVSLKIDKDIEDREEFGEDYADADEDEQQLLLAVAPVATHLPLEAMEVIFSWLSMKDLISCRLTCQRWNSIISREKASCHQQLLLTYRGYYCVST